MAHDETDLVFQVAFAYMHDHVNVRGHDIESAEAKRLIATTRELSDAFGKRNVGSITEAEAASFVVRLRSNAKCKVVKGKVVQIGEPLTEPEFKRRLAMVVAIFDYAIECGLCERNPFVGSN